MIFHRNTFGLAALLAATVTIGFSEGVQASVFAPDYTEFESSAVVTSGGISARLTTGLAIGQNSSSGGAFSDFSALPGLVEVNFNNINAGGAGDFTTGSLLFSAEKGFGVNGTNLKADVWAPANPDGSKNDSQYLAVFNGNKVTVSLGQTMNYMGINWGALSPNNTFTLLREGAVVGSFNYDSINPLAPTYAPHQNQQNAYLHLYADSDEALFDTLVLEQVSTHGGGFEVDNFSYIAADSKFEWQESVPEPGMVVGLLAIGGTALLKRRNDSAQLDG
jgi:hypothetical protein